MGRSSAAPLPGRCTEYQETLDWLGFLGLAAQKRGDVQIVGADVGLDVTDVLLDLVDHVG